MGDWILKRNDTKEAITLPEDVRWIDESEWSPKAQTPPRRMRAGAAAMHESKKLSGRPITLSCEDEVWIKLGKIKKLKGWESEPKLTLTLIRNNILPAETYQVTFRTHDGAINSTPVKFSTPESDDDDYTAIIPLIEVGGV